MIHDLYDTFTKHNALQSLINSLGILQGQYELILVLNNSDTGCPRTAGYLNHVASTRPGTRLVATGENRGCGAGFNHGARFASDDASTLVYVSPDALVVDPHILAKMETVLGMKPRVGCIHPLSVYEDAATYNYSREYSAPAFYKKAIYSDGRGNPPPSGQEQEEMRAICSDVLSRPMRTVDSSRYFPLTFLGIRRSVFDALNGFDEGFFAGGENMDFPLRALQRGFRSVVLANSFIYHRRILFRYLGSGGKDRDLDRIGARRFDQYWMRKWGVSPEDAYREIVFGRMTFRHIVSPALKLLRRLRGCFTRACK